MSRQICSLSREGRYRWDCEFRWLVVPSSHDEGTLRLAPDIEDVASEVSQCRTKDDTSSPFRVVARFLESYDKADWPTRERVVSPRPTPTGSARYDAMLVGIVEYACATQRILAPAWFNEPVYFLDELCFVSGTKSLHANAIVHSPISFKRRGVFLTRGAQTYA
jgi:hypothetical protein